MVKAISVLIKLIVVTGLLLVLACSGDNPLGPSVPLPEALGWVEQESPVENHLLAVNFVDSRRGWIAGDRGMILHTIDGGNNWRIQNSGTTNILRDIEFVSLRTGWAVGDNGTILYTENGGRSWKQKETDVTARLEEVVFIDDNTGWISGRNPYTILKTTDGGQNWTNISSGDWRSVRKLRFIDKENGLAIGDAAEMFSTTEGIVSTTDGGATWTVNQEIFTFFISDIIFKDPDTGLFISASYGVTNYEDGSYDVGWHDLVYKTTDGGKSWAQIYRNLGNYMMFGNIFILENNNLLVVGIWAIVSSNDGGNTWTTQFQEYDKEFYSSTFIDSKVGWAVGRDGLILHTTNGGVTPPTVSN